MPFLTTTDLFGLVLQGALRSPLPRYVADVKWEIVGDPAGNDAIYLLILLDDAIPHNLRNYGALAPIADHLRGVVESALRDSTQLRMHPTPNVYTSFRLKSEHEAIVRGGGR